MSDLVTRAAVEDFLHQEADLLDDWRLNDWLALFTDDGRYEIPSADLPPDASPDVSLFYIADDRFRLGERVARLLKKTGHAEYPHSKTRHFVSNVRIGAATDDGLRATANFLCYRSKDGKIDQYWGKAYYALVTGADGLLIRTKRCVLDVESLFVQGRITVIL